MGRHKSDEFQDATDKLSDSLDEWKNDRSDEKRQGVLKAMGKWFSKKKEADEECDEYANKLKRKKGVYSDE